MNDIPPFPMDDLNDDENNEADDDFVIPNEAPPPPPPAALANVFEDFPAGVIEVLDFHINEGQNHFHHPPPHAGII